MHLSAVRIRGFKSFRDPIELRFEPGVSVIVGPNGSGKSNVADAIRWAAGSLSPNELLTVAASLDIPLTDQANYQHRVDRNFSMPYSRA